MAVTYTLRYRPTGSGSWTEVEGLTSTSRAVTGLSAGTEYEVEVVAVSDGGVESTPVTGGRWTVFGQPSAPSASPAGYVLSSGDDGSNGAVDVSWTAVAGATSYTVSHRETGQGDGAWVEVTGLSGTSARLSGLDGATTHEVRVAVVNGDGVASTPSSATTGASAVVATGGTVTTFVGNGTIGTDGTRYVVHEFTTDGSLDMKRARDVEYLVVGGGGGGGARVGAGGGGGAMRTGTLTGLTGTTSVTVGGGGSGATTPTASGSVTQGSDGGDSALGAITADGGGRGASNIVPGIYGHTAGPSAENTGASGGGGARTTAAGTGGAYGNSGGAGHEPGTGSVAAGGGGGAGATGGDASPSTAGNGGAGASSTITGTSRFFAAGGGGSAHTTAAAGDGSGGSGIGGDGAGTPETAVAITAGSGTNGTGSGGGGSSSSVGANTGGAGGSGVVIVRYALPA